MRFPGGAPAALTILDDADLGTRANLEPVYDALYEHGIVTTRSTWILPARRADRATGSLADADYVSWLEKIRAQGFEIALHNAGNGIYTRPEILAALDLFRSAFGEYPRVHCNHHSNPDGIYWSARHRFAWPVSLLYRAFGHDRRAVYHGHDPHSPFFWGDFVRDHMRFVRSLVFNEVNTLAADPYMPYWDRRRPLVPFWFSSTDLRDAARFCRVLSPGNLDRLCAEGGACVGYTHFGVEGFLQGGRPAAAFLDVLREVKARGIWVAPVSTVLEHLLQERGYYDCELSYWKALRLSSRWMLDRAGKT